MHLLFSVALGIFALFSILAMGSALVLRIWPSLRGVVLAAHAAAVGVMALALIGVLTATGLLPPRWAGTFGLVGGDGAAVVYLVLRQKDAVKSLLTDRAALFGIGATAAAAILSLAIALTPISMPDPLVDGPYVFKNHNLHVRIQHIVADLPADNVLPHIVDEFLMRHIPFQQERPILPGQEVSNRPILMSLAALPFRDLIAPPARQEGPLDRFTYLNISWPDVEPLADDADFLQFLAVGVILNALVLLGAALIMDYFSVAPGLRLAAMLCLTVSPYFLSQILFTWPKAMAGFYLILALHSALRKRDVRETGCWTAGAYWSHPYAIIFALAFAAYFYMASDARAFREKIAVSSRFLLVWGLCILPWFIWTRLYLRIPSDLISQNLMAHQPLGTMIWARLVNFYEVLAPFMFEIYPFNGNTFFSRSITCLPGVLGLLLFIPAYAAVISYWRSEKLVCAYYIVLGGALVAGIFSVPSVAVLHGFQAIGPVMVMLAIRWMQDKAIAEIRILALLSAQIALNAVIWIVRMVALHHHAVT